MRWIGKNESHFFEGLDELYHRAKFGEYRTTRASDDGRWHKCDPSL